MCGRKKQSVRRKSMKKTVKLFALLIALVTCVSIFAACKTEPTTDPNETKYNEAFDQSEAGDYAR